MSIATSAIFFVSHFYFAISKIKLHAQLGKLKEAVSVRKEMQLITSPPLRRFVGGAKSTENFATSLKGFLLAARSLSGILLSFLLLPR